MTTNSNLFDTVKNTFAPVSDALKNIQNVDVPEAARDFAKRAAGTAKDRAADIHAGAEKVTASVEQLVAGSLSETSKISRNLRQAMYEDAVAFFNGIEKLASAKSVGEAFQINTDLLRAQGEVLVSRAKATTEYVGNVLTESAKTTQDNLSKVTAYATSKAA